jgi:hypothetical protein
MARNSSAVSGALLQPLGAFLKLHHRKANARTAGVSSESPLRYFHSQSMSSLGASVHNKSNPGEWA